MEWRKGSRPLSSHVAEVSLPSYSSEKASSPKSTAMLAALVTVTNRMDGTQKAVEKNTERQRPKNKPNKKRKKKENKQTNKKQKGVEGN